MRNAIPHWNFLIVGLMQFAKLETDELTIYKCETINELGKHTMTAWSRLAIKNWFFRTYYAKLLVKTAPNTAIP
jgi:hypothetical protein